MADQKSFHMQYFASFRETIGLREETVRSTAATAADLYREIALRSGLSIDLKILRVALNDEVVPWTTPVNDGDTVVFLAPFAGG